MSRIQAKIDALKTRRKEVLRGIEEKEEEIQAVFARLHERKERLRAAKKAVQDAVAFAQSVRFTPVPKASEEAQEAQQLVYFLALRSIGQAEREEATLLGASLMEERAENYDLCTIQPGQILLSHELEVIDFQVMWLQNAQQYRMDQGETI